MRELVRTAGFIAAAILTLNVDAATAGNVVFDCQKKLDVSGDPSAPEWVNFGITVTEYGTTYTAILTGGSDPSPQTTTVQSLALADALKVGGVSDVLSASNITPANRAKITTVKVYTTGNFDDDAAGVRAAEFLDSNDASLAKGMFFGWAGPHLCD